MPNAPNRRRFSFTSRKKVITIDNSAFASNLTDYQVKVVLNQNNFYFASLHSDKLDLHFTDTSGNSLPHWIELYDLSGQNAVIWVKVPSIPALGKTTIYLSYGSPSSVSPNGDATFDLFDDFNTLPSAWVKSGSVLTPTQTWEGTMVRDPSVLYQSDQYNMWYWNDNTSIGYATSPDGLNWTKYSGNPVFTNVLRPSVVYKSGTYYLFYAKTDETAIGLATSTNPQGPFTDQGLVLWATQTWESGMIRVPSVWFDQSEGLFKLWYSAGSISPAGVSWTEPAAIGYATSPDGINWTKYANNPIMQGLYDGSWLSQAIETLRVYKLDNTYYGFYHAADYWGISRIGLTTSTDGITWNPQASDLILDLGKYGDFDADFLYTTAPVYNNGWKLWYNGRNSDNANEIIGLATLKTNIAQLNTSKWARSRRCEVSVANSVARFTMFTSTSLAYDAHDYFVWSAKQFQEGIFEARVQIPSGYSDQYSLVAIGSRFNGTYHNILNSINPDYYGNMTLYELLIGAGTMLSNTVRTGKFVNATETIFTPHDKTTINRDVWYILKIDINGSNIKTYIDDVLTYTGTDSFIPQQGSLFLRILETDGLVDWVRFRKHADTEPTATVSSIAHRISKKANSTVSLAQRYWELLHVLVARNLKVRYRGSFLGVYWSLLNPLLMTGVYTAIFGATFASYYGNSILNYVLAVFTGLVVINFFSAATSQALWSVVNNGSLLNKIRLPVSIFPVSIIAANVFQLMFGVLPLLVVMTLINSKSMVNVMALLLPLLALALLCAGIGFLVSALFVFFRDLPYFYELVVFALWISSPIFYPAAIVPVAVKSILVLNPLLPIIESIRQISLSGELPELSLIGQSLLSGVITLALGWNCFRWWRSQFMDLL